MTTAETSEDPEASADLVRRAQSGDRSAFDALIRRNERRLARLVGRRMGRELRGVEESSDVVQSALAEAVRALPAFEYRGEGSFLRWLGTIVESRVRNHVRALRRDKRDPAREAGPGAVQDATTSDPSPSQVAIGREYEDRYENALERLPAEDKELLLLHLEIGASHAEIGEALGLPSPDAARMRVARALARMQILMRESAP